MAKKDLVKQVEAIGVTDAADRTVKELKSIILAAQVVAEEGLDHPARVLITEKANGRHAAHARGTSQGVHLQLGHIVDNGEGVMVFQFASEFVVGREEALVLAEELGHASADAHRARTTG